MARSRGQLGAQVGATEQEVAKVHIAGWAGLRSSKESFRRENFPAVFQAIRQALSDDLW